MSTPAALRPLDEAADSVRRLHEYETPAELGSAVDVVWKAIERSLRLFLRSDPGAPESHRMSALSRDGFTFEEVVQSLRSRDRISIELAGAVHGLRAAAERVGGQDAGPADADIAIRAVEGIRREVAAAGPAADTPPPPDEPITEAGLDDTDAEEAPHPGGGRWMAWLASALALAFVVSLVWVFARGAGQDYDEAVQAFRSGRLDSAAAGFERVVDDQPSNVSAMLYLGRIYRRQLRYAEAADVLRTAAAEAPEDDDVRRELGHLFMDLDRPDAAVRQYERALEQEPEEVRNWAGLIRALRARGDPRAEELLRDAPPEVQAMLGPPGDGPQRGGRPDPGERDG